MDGTFISSSPIIEKYDLADQILKDHAKLVFRKLSLGLKLSALEETKLEAAKILSQKVLEEGVNASAYQFQKLRKKLENSTLDNFLKDIQSANMNADMNPIDSNSTAVSKTMRYIDGLDSGKLEQLRQNKIVYNQFCLKAHQIMSAPVRKGKVSELKEALETMTRVIAPAKHKVFKVHLKDERPRVSVVNRTAKTDSNDSVTAPEVADEFHFNLPQVEKIGSARYLKIGQEPGKFDVTAFLSQGVSEDIFDIKTTRHEIFSDEGSINSAANSIPLKLRTLLDREAQKPKVKERLKSETSLARKNRLPALGIAMLTSIFTMFASPTHHNTLKTAPEITTDIVVSANLAIIDTITPVAMASSISMPSLSKLIPYLPRLTQDSPTVAFNSSVSESYIKLDTAPELNSVVSTLDIPKLDSTFTVPNQIFNDVAIDVFAPNIIELSEMENSDFVNKTLPNQPKTALAFETIPDMVKAYYDVQNISVPNTLQTQFDKFEIGMHEINNPNYKGHAEEAAFEMLKISTRTFGADFLDAKGYQALDILQDRDGILDAKNRAEVAENYYKMKYPTLTNG